MLDAWFLIVPSATPSELAISLLEKPLAISSDGVLLLLDAWHNAAGWLDGEERCRRAGL